MRSGRFIWCHRLYCLVILAGLIACDDESSQMERLTPNQPIGDILVNTVTGTFEGAWEAVQTPFEDINIKQKPIPDKLQQISDNPYAIPKKMLCEGIRREIAELDALLGPDVCTPGQPTGLMASRKGEYVDKGTNFARDQVIHMVSSKANIIPFRGVVRNISGAEKHTKALERAYQAGKLRRAFLKGLAVSLKPHCLESSPKITTASAAAITAEPHPPQKDGE